MQMTFDTIIKGGTIVNQDGIGQADIGIKDGKIMGLGDLGQASADKTISATGLTVLPGVVDSQVHFREPGNEHKEDLETGSRAHRTFTAVFAIAHLNWGSSSRCG